jgi:hypothetical protein
MIEKKSELRGATQTTIKLVSREEINDVLILHPTYIVNYYIS